MITLTVTLESLLPLWFDRLTPSGVFPVSFELSPSKYERLPLANQLLLITRSAR
jgi:hypothetical protein